MKIDIISLFPAMFEGPFRESIIGRAQGKGLVEINVHDMHRWAWNSYGAVDDRPYGGGVGMVIRPDVISNALKEIKKGNREAKIIATSAKGERFKQAKAETLAQQKGLIIICGHYEGFDQRILDYMADEVISIGDYVLTGGELAAMVITDATARLLPGVLGKDESSQVESFSKLEIEGKKMRVTEYPQYTRPFEYEGHQVPEVLLSGDPKKIRKWQETRLLEKR